MDCVESHISSWAGLSISYPTSCSSSLPIPSIQMCISLVFTQTAGYMLADVMTDALIVERSRYESEDKRGSMQSRGYIVRFFGSTVGAIIGAVVYNKTDWDWYLPINLVFFINAAFPIIFLLPFVPYLLETRDQLSIQRTFTCSAAICFTRHNCDRCTCQ